MDIFTKIVNEYLLKDEENKEELLEFANAVSGQIMSSEGEDNE
ncbi:hypothetical protein JOC34_000547 [Virgibacillus halotolerans]|nr:hypothetical protein [Virgibacillus halotolerans]